MTEKPSASRQADLPPLAFDDLGCTERERALFSAAAAELEAAGEPGPFALGRVVSLDRSLPLVMSEKDVFRAEHDVRMAKENQLLPAIGDWVVAALPQGHDQGIIEQVLPRARTLPYTKSESTRTKNTVPLHIAIQNIGLVASRARYGSMKVK